jgi:hypothetical protein
MEQLGHFPMSENPSQFRRYIAPVLGQILAAESGAARTSQKSAGG